MVDVTQLSVAFNVKESNDADALALTVSATVNCTDAQLIVFAKRGVSVAVQRVVRGAMRSARKDGKRFKKSDFENVTFDAAALLRGETDPAKRLERAKAVGAKLDDAGKRAMIAELQAALDSAD